MNEDDDHPLNGPHPTDIGGNGEHPLDGPHPTD